MTVNKSKFEKFFSFNIDETELENQITNYDSLKINKSYRGISALIIFGIAIMSLLVIMMLGDEQIVIEGKVETVSMESAMMGALICAIIGFFVLKGRKWAMVTAMVLWTYNKAVSAFYLLQIGSGGLLTVIFFWIVVMRFFWRAVEVENYRKELADLMKDQ